MTNVDKSESSKPAVVTGDERAHPAVRLLARAAIELARQQIARSKEENEATKASESNADREEGGGRG